MLKLQDSVKKVPVDTIRYVEIQNRMLYYYTSRGEYVVRGTIKSALDMLAPYHFVKCNHWYIVNLKYVTEVRDNTAIVAGKELEIQSEEKNTF
ncbi:MAG: LytR/AlgR family response regulator transcription factor [Mediterraneibacter gnavus]